MKEKTDRDWHTLHIRVARGEVLTTQEQAFYESELSRMHTEEVLSTDIEMLLQMRNRIKELETENRRLQAQRVRLDREITAIESQLNERTKRMLGVGKG